MNTYQIGLIEKFQLIPYSLSAQSIIFLIASLEGCLYMPSAQNNHTHQKTFCGVATSLQDSKPKTNLRQL